MTKENVELLNLSPTASRLEQVFKQANLLAEKRFIQQPNKRLFVNVAEAEDMAASENPVDFFTKVVPVEEHEVEEMFSIKENGTVELRDKYTAMIVGYHEIMQSAKLNRVLVGRVTQMINRNGMPGLAFMHGGFEVFIPYFHYDDSQDYDESSSYKGDFTAPKQLTEAEIKDINRMLAKRLGSIAKVKITHFLPQERIAIANRRQAMNALRYKAFVEPNSQQISIGGELYQGPAVVVGNIVKARVLSVISSHIFCEFMGAEFAIATKDLHNGFINDARDYYVVGDELDVVIKSIKNDPEKSTEVHTVVEVVAEGVREMSDFDFFVKAIPEGTKCTGIVTQIDNGNVFVRVHIDSLNYFNDTERHKQRIRSHFDVVCKEVVYGVQPTRGSQVTVNITGYDKETQKGFFGTINHVANKLKVGDEL